MIIDLTDAHWFVTSDLQRGFVEIAVEATGQRFAAEVTEAQFPAFERLMDELPKEGQVDLSHEAVRVLGHDPFIECPVAWVPWYKRPFSGGSSTGTNPRR